LTTGFTTVSIGGSYSAPLTNSSGIWTGSDSITGLGFTFTEASGTLSVSAIPEPATYAAAFGALALAGAVWNRRRRSSAQA